MRLDVYLYSKCFVKSRQKAKSLIEEGEILVDGITIKKPSYEIDDNGDAYFVTNYHIA